MAAPFALADSETKTSPLAIVRDRMYVVLAGFAGVMLGIVGSFGFVANYMQSQYNAQSDALRNAIITMTPASDVSACYEPAGSGGGGVVSNAAAAGTHVAAANNVPEVGGKGADAPTPGGSGGGNAHPVVNQIINAGISNTGPGSNNTINASNNYTSNVTNNNNVNVTNNNNQEADSGDATVSKNTSGGSATTGTASNENHTSTSISIDN